MVTLHYDVAQKKLKAENKIQIDHLTLGAKNQSPDATHLPVKLAIALLKDRNGRIELDVPLSGSLDDPQFKLGPIILKVFVNILTKVATSPFSLLGALFGGGEELSYVDFAAGRADISPGEGAKLEKLGKALYERPELNLEIAGAVELAADREALARVKLEQQAKSFRAKELISAGTPAEMVEAIHLEPADYERLIKAIYVEKFGTNLILQTSAKTNSAGEVKSVAAVSKVSAKQAKAVAESATAIKGAEVLLGVKKPQKSAAKSTNSKSRSDAPTASSAKVATDSQTSSVVAGNEITLPDMEAKLLAGIEITDNDLRELMQARLKSVQAFLLKSGKVTGERLLLLAPKPVNPSAKGETRVNLSLE